MSKVYILILNWNGWQDTIECLESVLKNDYPYFQIIICDNDSQDGSMAKIRQWALGSCNCLTKENPSGRFLDQKVRPLISFVEYDRKQAELGGNRDSHARLILIQNGANLGFAGGNNVGLRYALAKNDFEYVWLLNNDTVIKKDALSEMVLRMKDNPKAGICGSTLPFYGDKSKIWALGGATYNKWLAKPRCIGLHETYKVCTDSNSSTVENQMAFVAGASMLVSYEFLHNIGIISEDYFLYFEELDWAARARGRYDLIYAPKSVVYHKVGASTAFNDSNKKSRIAAYFMLKSSILFTVKYFPFALPLVLPRVGIIYLVKRIRSLLNDFSLLISKIK